MIEPGNTTLLSRRRVPKEDRKRASRACYLCRSRKSRCIPTDSGSCWRCRRRGLRCIYEDGLFNDEISTPSPRYAVSAGPSASTMTASQAGLRRTENRPDNSPNHLSERPQNELPESNPLLPVNGATEAYYSGATSNELFLAKIRESMFMGPSTSRYTEKATSLNDNYVPQLDPSDRRLVNDALAQFPPKSVAEFLLSVYFHYAEDSYFCFHQPLFRSRLGELYDSQMARATADPSFVCSVLMVFALGSQFAQFKSPNVNATPKPGDFQEDPGSIFYQRARMLLPAIISRCTIEAIQACAAMATYCLHSRPRDLGYFYLGLALKIAVASGLHRKVSEPSLSKDIVETRNRIWWSVYSLERVLSVKMGRPESIQEEDIDAPLPTFCSELDFPEAQSNILLQMANINLTRILNRIVRRASHIFSGPSELIKSQTDELKSELKEWKRNLSDSLRIRNVNSKEKGFRAVVHLYMNYYHAWIIITRIPLLLLVRERLKHSFQDVSLDSAKNEHIELLAQSCVKAANKMLSLFEVLTENEHLARFSFTDFQGCSTATIIILLQGILKRDSGYESKLTFAFNSLRFMSFGSETAEVGLKLVESFQTLADEAIQRLNSSSEGSVPRQQTVSGYQDWERWLSDETRNTSSLARETLTPDSFTFPNREAPVDNFSGSVFSAENMGSFTSTEISATESGPGETSASESRANISASTAPTGLQSEGSHQHNSESSSSTALDGRTVWVPDQIDDSFMLGFTGLDLFNFSALDDLTDQWDNNSG